jgi:hypothetical protein
VSLLHTQHRFQLYHFHQVHVNPQSPPEQQRTHVLERAGHASAWLLREAFDLLQATKRTKKEGKNLRSLLSVCGGGGPPMR